MSELLLELFSEEIPARMQERASGDLARMVGEALKAAGVEATAARAFATPRRLTLVIDGLPAKTPDVKEERKGPKVGAPQQAIDGFLRAAGLTSIEQAQVQEDKKGAFYIALTEKKGRPTAELIAEIVPQVIRDFPWPKSMRSGRHELRWVRPLHSIICLLDGAVVPFDVDGIASGNSTRGHRFMAPDAFTVTGFADYEAKLRKAFVVLDAGTRAKLIHEGALKLAADAGLKLFEDEALLHEVSGLVEWPVPLIGKIDDQFMSVPQEVLTSTMRANQKYFALTAPFETTATRSPQGEDEKNGPHPEEARSAVSKDGPLAPRFIVIANLIAQDDGQAIVNGNERVLRARFSDARFLWEQDKKQTLKSRLPKLQEVVFHAKLGTVYDKAMRIGKLARELAPYVLASTQPVIAGLDPAIQSDSAGSERPLDARIKSGHDVEEFAAKAQIAGELCKTDLTSGMVREFPELQGIMGSYFAAEDKLGEDMSVAIAQHYSPQGPDDFMSDHPLAQTVALADKLDTLKCFWSIDEKPTGSKDPFALRRAALGVIRIILEYGLRLHLLKFVDADLLAFFADRLKVYLRDRGARHDLVDAVFALEGQDDLVLIVKRVKALSDFLGSDDGKNLLAGYKRAVNILRIEEKKDGIAYDEEPDPKYLVDGLEIELAKATDNITRIALSEILSEDFVAAMAALAKLRAPVDAFFDKVTVNADDANVRANRLRLLSQIRNSLHTVADFSKIEG